MNRRLAFSAASAHRQRKTGAPSRIESTTASSACRLQRAQIPSLLLAAALTAASADLPAAEMTARIAGVTYVGDAPTLVADRRGHFSDHGLRAEVIYGDAGKRGLERLRAGEVDFALMALTPLVRDRLADLSPGGPGDPVILANIAHATRFHQIVTLGAGPLREPAGLAGRRLGLAMGTNAEFIWWLFARYHGIDPDGVELVDRPLEGLGDTLVNGTVDAAVMWAPWTDRLRAWFDGDLRSLDGGGLYTAKWVLVARRHDGARATQRAVLAAYRDAVEYIQPHPDEALRAYAEHADVAPAHLRDGWNASAYQVGLDWSLIGALQTRFAWVQRDRDPRDTASPDVLSLLAPGPLRDLVPATVGVPPGDHAR